MTTLPTLLPMQGVVVIRDDVEGTGNVMRILVRNLYSTMRKKVCRLVIPYVSCFISSGVLFKHLIIK